MFVFKTDGAEHSSVVFMFTHLYINIAALNLVRRRPGRRKVGRESDVILF